MRTLLSASNALVDATLSVIYGAVDAEFPLTALVDGDPTEAAKFTTPYALILATFAAPVHLALLALVHHNLDPDLVIELRGYTSAPVDETTPADLTVTTTIGALEKNNFRPNAWFDVEELDDPSAFKYWGIFIDGSGANLAIGELWADVVQTELPNGIGLQGSGRGPVFETIRNETYGGVALKARKRTRQQTFTVAIAGDLDEIVDVEDFFNELEGMAGNALLIPDANAEAVHLVEVMQDALPETPIGPGGYTTSVALRELSRGLAWD